MQRLDGLAPGRQQARLKRAGHVQKNGVLHVHGQKKGRMPTTGPRAVLPEIEIESAMEIE